MNQLHQYFKNLREKTSKARYVSGFNRLYFVISIVVYVYFTVMIVTVTVEEDVNVFVDEPLSVILILVGIFLYPFVMYILLVTFLKIIRWVGIGFTSEINEPPVAHKGYFPNDSFFSLVKKHNRLFFGTLFVLLIIIISTTIFGTRYSSFNEKVENTKILKNNRFNEIRF